jgi:hypothetical protein
VSDAMSASGSLPSVKVEATKGNDPTHLRVRVTIAAGRPMAHDQMMVLVHRCLVEAGL